MNIDLFVIIVGILSFIIGTFIGIGVFKVYNNKQNKKLLENAKEVLNGNRENKIKIDGQEYDASKFRIRDDDDKEIVIDLQKGGTVQDGRREENSSGIEKIQEQKVETPTEISSSSGKKKRIIRVRSILSRIRRFG